MLFKVSCLIICSLLCATSLAHALQICGDIKQGELLLIKETNSHKIRLQNEQGKKEYPVIDGVALVALHRDAPSYATLYTDSQKFALNIAPNSWDIQKISGVAPHYVAPDKKQQQEIRREQQDVAQALSNIQPIAVWRNSFIEPLHGRISGNFGNQRIFNNVPKSPHSGTDIAAAEGTEIKAAGDGIVTLSGQDYFYTGNLIIIDHGQGLQTIYAHLQKSSVTTGQHVKKGDIIGYVGSTGRATGPHLHWGAVLNGIRFRPHSLLDLQQKTCQKIIETQ